LYFRHVKEQGYIELKVTNRDNTLSPKDIDINEVKEFISDIESFLYPNRKKRQSIIDKLQKKAIREGYSIEFNNSISKKASLIINNFTNFEMVAPTFYESEFYLYGEIYQEGGKNPNLHITSKKFGNLTVSATKEQIMDGEKKTYKPYGIKVRGKKSFENDKPTDLELIEFIQYKPIFNKSLLDKVIEKASVNLSKITNVDTWIDDLKSEGA